MLEVLNLAADHFRTITGKVSWMIDASDAFVGPDFMKEAKRLNKEVFDQKVDKGAIIGISGIKKILLNAFNALSKQKLIPFSTKDQAMDFLAS